MVKIKFPFSVKYHGVVIAADTIIDVDEKEAELLIKDGAQPLYSKFTQGSETSKVGKVDLPTEEAVGKVDLPTEEAVDDLLNEDKLRNLTRKQLIELAHNKGIDIDEKAVKSQIIKKLSAIDKE